MKEQGKLWHLSTKVPVVASDEFSYVRIRGRHAKSAARRAEAFHRCPVLCGSTVISTRLYTKLPILGLDLTIQAEPMLCPGIPDSWPLDKVQLRCEFAHDNLLVQAISVFLHYTKPYLPRRL
jgi:hypothetical protein